jgi:uncharacterized membrane protein YdcZ (DUF606 family)
MNVHKEGIGQNGLILVSRLGENYKMKQLFKTTLLAATIAATCGTAVAGTVSVTKQVHSLEGLLGVTADQTANDITYKLGAAYREGDKITFDFTAGSLATNGFPTVINLAPKNDALEANAIAGLTLGLLNSDANSVTYRVTKLTLPHNGATTPVEWQNGSTLNADLTLSGVKYKASVVGAETVTVTVSSQTTAGDILDSAGTRTGTLAESTTQFGLLTVNTPFNGVIDVANMRNSFVGTLTDSMSYTVKNPTTTGWLNLATVNTSAVTLFGEAGKMTDVPKEAWHTGGTPTFTVEEAKLAIAYTGPVTNDTVTFTAPSGDKAIVLEAQKFTTDVVYNYTSAGAIAGSTTVATGADSGEWKLNGATVNIPYMPYSANASQIMYVSNASAQEGDIMVTAFDDKGNMYDLGVVGLAKGKTVTKITNMVGKKLLEHGFEGGKLSITVTVNAPSADVTVYASYNAGSVRGFVNTDQYKGKD